MPTDGKTVGQNTRKSLKCEAFQGLITKASVVNRLRRTWVWLRRIGHCRGFGIQSPTDYAFVRYVINEKWPYHAYDDVDDSDDDWLQRKLGRLYLRIANWRQPATIVDQVGAEKYLRAGCRKAAVVREATAIEMACVDINGDGLQLLEHCADGSILIFQHIWKDMARWHAVVHAPQATITYDLYYCGVVVIDSHRTKQSYIINF